MEAYDILDQAIEQHKPTHAFCMFSGGNDSLVTTHLSMEYLTSHYPDLKTGVAHINTGIGVEETREFVRSTCYEYSWPLVEYKTDPKVYEQLVEKYGFPGPTAHKYMYTYLKERMIWKLIADHRIKVKAHGRSSPRWGRILLITGVRKQESRRRMGSVEPIQVAGRQIWVAPLLNWSKEELLDYKGMWRLPRNEVCDVLHMSGECLCGAFAGEGELETLEVFYPDTAKRIHALQDKAHAAGHHWGWNDVPPHTKGMKERKGSIATLCSSCDGRNEIR